MGRNCSRFGFIIGFCTLTVACSVTHMAPVETRLVAQESAQSLGYHVVNAGETLYSIAFSYGLDYRQLASWNGIGKNFLIFPGQRLQLSGPRLTNRQNIGENVNNPSQNARNNPTRRPQSGHGSRPASQVGAEQNTSQAGSKNIVQNSQNASAHSGNVSESISTPKQESSATNWQGSVNVNWQWPALGSVLQHYSASQQGNKGLNIAGKKGEPVRAAADGMVVYAGGGLRGFGNLVIVKHNDDFLSAYAHNDSIRVKENDTVKAGQTIADIGDSGTDKVQLHFEIRYQGQPVDPLRYLPKR